MWRNAAGDHPIATWSHHFDPLPAGPTQFNAQPFEADARGAAAAAKANDQLVLRFSAQGSSTQLLIVPNSDGARAMGRIPSLTLPK